MADADLYSLLTGGGSPDPQAQAQAVAAQLRRRRSFGELGMLSGDPVLQPFGAQQLKSADTGAEEVARNRLSEAQQAQEKSYQGQSLAQSGAYQQGELEQGKNALAETIREHNLQNQQKMWEYGIGKNGAPDADFEKAVDAIGQYKVAPPNLNASRNPRNLNIISRVMEKYPDFDANQFSMAKKAESDFGTGKEGNMVRSANTAIAHIATLEKVTDALNNGDIPGLNAAKQIWAKQTGKAAPGNFNTVRTFVADELTKFLVSNGGGEGDRKKMEEDVSNSGSPQALKGVISHWKELMGGQLNSLKQQYEGSTRRTDFSKKLSPETISSLGWGQPGSDAKGTGASATGWKIEPVP